MTWFRVGGAGIPASLKNAMNAVLNKKFGTSGQNYPPSDWPADVNLMGPLPEKTASGAIANFTDGAYDVPLKSLVFGIEPVQASGTPSPSNPLPISGHTSLTGVHCGKNLLMLADSDYTNTLNNVTIDYNAETQKFSLSGQNQSSSAYILGNFQYSSLKNVVMKNATYTFSHNLPTGAYAQLSYRKVNSSSVGTLCYIAGNGTQRSVTFTLPADYDYTVNAQVGIAATAGDVNASDLYMQIEVGSSATSFAPYSAESKKWEFPQTVYSGQVNALTGEVESTGKKMVYDGSSDESWAISLSSGTYRAYIDILDADFPTSGRKYIRCSIGTYASSGNPEAGIFIAQGVSGGQQVARMFYVPPQTITTAEDFKTWLSTNNMEVLYDLATPISIDMNSVDWQSKYADNNFYCDTGDTSCEYRADIALALAALQSNRSVSLMRSGGPEEMTEDMEEIREPEENIQNTEEQEGENDAR